jgi:hypothetical protein
MTSLKKNLGRNIMNTQNISERMTLPNGSPAPLWEDQTKSPRILHVDQNHTLADDTNPGTIQSPFKTIQRAAELTNAGDRVEIHAGVYRETVRPHGSGKAIDQMLCFAAFEDDKVTITGAETITGPYRESTGWKRSRTILDGGKATEQPNEFADSKARVYMTKLPRETFVGVNPFAACNGPLIPWYGRDVSGAFRNARETPQQKLATMRRGMIFCDGKRLRQVLNYWELGELDSDGAFFVEGDALTIHLRFPGDDAPDGRLLEYTAREQCFCPEQQYSAFIKIEKLKFTKAGNGFPSPQRGAVSTNCGSNFIVENCTVEDVNGVGLDLGRQSPSRHDNFPNGGHQVLNCVIDRCGICGICGVPAGSEQDNYIDAQQCGVVIIGNRLHDNCWQDFEQLMESAAIKVHHLKDSLIAGNYVNGTEHGCGIWTDATCENIAVRENVVVHCRTAYGAIFIEASHYDLQAAYNVVVDCKSSGGENGGSGIYSHNCDEIVNFRNVVLDCENFGFNHIYGSTGRIYRGRGNTGYGMEFIENIISDCRWALMVPTDRCKVDRNVYGNFIEGGQLKVGFPPLHLDLRAWRKYLHWDQNGFEAVIGFVLNANASELRTSFKGPCSADTVLKLHEPLAQQIDQLCEKLQQV